MATAAGLVIPEGVVIKKGEMLRAHQEHVLLSQFDEQRAHRPVVTDRRKVTVPVRTLNAELECRVCLGIIRKTTCVMDCLHRFCAGCIEKSLRLGKKECPTCRIPCPSRRSLRRDENFDKLIATIYPDLTQAEAQQDSIVEEIINAHSVKAFAETVATLKEKQRAAIVRGRPRSRSRDPDTSAASSAGGGEISLLDAIPEGEEDGSLSPPRARQRSRDAGTRSRRKKSRGPKPDALPFQLSPMPSVPAQYHLALPFVVTSRLATVLQLQKYLALRLQTPPTHRYILWAQSHPSAPPQPLSASLSLDLMESSGQACQNGQGVLQLYYSVNVSAYHPNPSALFAAAAAAAAAAGAGEGGSSGSGSASIGAAAAVAAPMETDDGVPGAAAAASGR